MTAPAATALAEHASEIRRLGKQTVDNVVEIGRRLTECRNHPQMKHGDWLPWLKREFDWSQPSAQRFMDVYRFASDAELPKLSNLGLPVSALYQLAAPPTPKPAKTEIIERAQAGEHVSVVEVKRVVERHKPPSSRPRKTRPAKVAAPPPQPSTEAPQPAAESPVGPAPPAPPPPPPRDDIGPDSRSAADHLRERNEELEREKRQLKLKVEQLEREVEELRGKLATATGGDMSISEFQIAHKQWEEAFETQRGIIARLEKDNANLRAAKRELDEIIAAQADDDALPLADDGAPCDSEDADLVDAYAQRGCNDDEVPDIPEPAPLPAAAPPANDGLDISECLRR